MPSNQSPLGALPSRFRRQRLLIVGCGDIGSRVVSRMPQRVQVLALTSQASRVPHLRALGCTPLMGNLDTPSSLRRLAGLAHRVLHLAPPASDGWSDRRTKALVQALRSRGALHSLVYGSTSGVYGDCQGAWIDETRAVAADTTRAQRRVDAESHVRFLGRSAGVRASILRIPGIYAPDRPGGTPQVRLSKGTPVLQAEEDVFTNHIHAEDLARACLLALWRGAAQRVYNINDDTQLKMGDYFDLAADLYQMPHPPRVSRQAAQTQLPVTLLSFMSESRRMRNTRMKQELRLALQFPTVAQGLVERVQRKRA
ncbi:SDR family oxidoreductase [Rhodoferax aquaticus]|uniref:SDR family oxidoreductase n=1 Tax=Rhodoferax aquaticus TaxID=2527691 RepID=A0A515ES79_9BURK|nr:SDR family oxidoreductase [Rhodoferax aquaticus]QDL55514.1 SDR family oxidoreductase [Rhodoferax aquaticus]